MAPVVSDYTLDFPLTEHSWIISLEAVSMEVYFILTTLPSCWTLEACEHPRAFALTIP